MNNHSLDIRKFSVRPPIIQMEDLVALPGYSCLFDLNGCRIEETRRDFTEGPFFSRKSDITQAPRFCEIPNNLDPIEKPVIYGGQIGSHYGHFLCDHMSRIWPIFDEYKTEALFFF